MAVGSDWIEEILQKSSVVSPKISLETELANLLIEVCKEQKKSSGENLGLLYAAAFDLLVATQYYAALAHSGWLYCPVTEPRLLFQYTNCCPRCALKNDFHFHVSNKPFSGKIGAATSRLLLLFLQSLLRSENRDEEVLKGSEPVDAIIINRKKKKVLFAEIKASPLLTPVISAESEKLTEEVDGEIVEQEHNSVNNTRLFESKLQIMVPTLSSSNLWEANFFDMGKRDNATDKKWGFRGILSLLNNDSFFFPQYFQYWKSSFSSYHPKKPNSIYWLTNACGSPSPIPSNWPQRRTGKGYESVSDAKTSVGMDRTDDIKKGIYQVLKLGAQGKLIGSSWDYKVGLLSNIHAARHFHDYLDSLKDVVWTLDESKRAKKVSDLPAKQDLYNLFDGIIALTSTLSRDEWIDELSSCLT